MTLTRKLAEALDDPTHWERDLLGPSLCCFRSFYGDTRHLLRRMFQPNDVIVFVEKNADGTRTQHTKPIEQKKQKFSCWDPESWFWRN